MRHIQQARLDGSKPFERAYPTRPQSDHKNNYQCDIFLT